MTDVTTISLFDNNLGINVHYEVPLDVLEYIEDLEHSEEVLGVQLVAAKEAFISVASELNATLNLIDKTHIN